MHCPRYLATITSYPDVTDDLKCPWPVLGVAVTTPPLPPPLGFIAPTREPSTGSNQTELILELFFHLDPLDRPVILHHFLCINICAAVKRDSFLSIIFFFSIFWCFWRCFSKQEVSFSPSAAPFPFHYSVGKQSGMYYQVVASPVIDCCLVPICH